MAENNYATKSPLITLGCPTVTAFDDLLPI